MNSGLAWWVFVSDILILTLAATDRREENGYEIVTPMIQINYAGTLTLYIAHYTLHLKSQKLPPGFTSIYYRNEEEIVDDDFAGCIYEGAVESQPHWKVSLTLCNGIQGHFGDDRSKEHYYYIEPLDLEREDNSVNQPHVLYSESTQQPVNLSTGMCATASMPGQAKMEMKKQRLSPVASQVFEPGQRIVELVLVNDHTQYLQLRRRLSAVILRDVEIVNYMNELFRSLNISIALVGVVTWTERDLIRIPPDNDPVMLLIMFKEYYYYIPGYFDCSLLISGRDFKDSVVGLAYKSSMCYGRYAVGVVQDRRPTLAAVGGTATHELGHILGMSHDELDGRPCACTDRAGKCIMASVAPPLTPSTMWSNCSVSDMETSFATYPATESCLYNEPRANVTIPLAEELTGRCYFVETFTTVTLVVTFVLVDVFIT